MFKKMIGSEKKDKLKNKTKLDGKCTADMEVYNVYDGKKIKDQGVGFEYDELIATIATVGGEITDLQSYKTDLEALRDAFDNA